MNEEINNIYIYRYIVFFLKRKVQNKIKFKHKIIKAHLPTYIFWMKKNNWIVILYNMLFLIFTFMIYNNIHTVLFSKLVGILLLHR